MTSEKYLDNNSDGRLVGPRSFVSKWLLGQGRNQDHSNHRSKNPDNYYIGKNYGLLTIIKRVENNKRQERVFLVKCKCGNEKEAALVNMKRRKIKSCGCLKRKKRNNGHRPV